MWLRLFKRHRLPSAQAGAAYDALTRNRRWLGVAHLCLGTLSTYMYYVRPASYHPRVALPSGYAVELAAVTLLGWAPYLLSWRVSLSLLETSPKGAMVFIVLATATTLAAAGFYLEIFPYHPSMILLSSVVALLLITWAYISFVVGGHGLDE